jgi:hypothetical protein
VIQHLIEFLQIDVDATAASFHVTGIFAEAHRPPHTRRTQLCIRLAGRDNLI